MTNPRRILLAALGLIAAIGCERPDPGNEAPPDTVTVTDTLIVRDTVIRVDTLVLTDTVTDTVVVVDTVFVEEPADTTVGQVGEEPQDTFDLPDPPMQGDWPDNEPAGLTMLTHITGESLDWPGWNKVGRGWPGDTFPTRLFVVSDPDSKYGSALEKRYFEGDISGWGWTKERQNVGPRWEFPRSDHKEIYVRFVFKYSPNWDYHSGGEKLFMHGATTYVIGGVPHPTATFPTFPQGKVTSGGYSWLPIIPGMVTPQGMGANRGRQEGYFPAVSKGEYHTIEIWKRRNDPGQVNGAMRWWLDGVEYTRFYKLGGPEEWYDVSFDSIAWNGWSGARLEAPLYWGGQDDTKTVND